MERINSLSRLLTVQISEMSEDSPDFVSSSWKGIFSSLNIQPLDHSFEIDTTKMSDDFLLADAYTLVDYLTFETHHENSILAYLQKIRENARQNQEQINHLIWPHINKKYLEIKNIELQDIWPDKILSFYKDTLEFTYLFYGLIQSSFYQDAGFHFIELGKNIERFQNTARIFETHLQLLMMTDKKEHDDLIGLLLRCGAFHSYRKVHSLQLDFRKVIDFLLYDSHFPFSLRFSYQKIKVSIQNIHGKTKSNFPIYEQLEKIDSLLKEGYKGSPLFKFLNSLYKEAYQINQDLNNIYLNYKSLLPLIKNDQQ